jgi:nucleotide-binding universal stress UspA family protein
MVAGFDGSAAAHRAARWAAAEADALGKRLLIVHGTADRLPPPGSNLVATPLAGVVEGSGAGTEAFEPIREQLAIVAEHVRRNHPKLDVVVSVRGGTPESVLASAAAEAGAAMIVLGESGTGAFARALLGTTEDAVSRTAGCPVVVVRGEHPNPRGPVVLGADGAEQSAGAMGFAFGFAARHGLPLHVVHGWTSADWAAATDPMYPGQLAAPPPENLLAAMDELIERRLQPWLERCPDVPVRRVRSEESAAKALTDHSEDAALLVVGSHGHSELWRLLLGSVSKAAVHHAHCPVAIVRAA